MAAGDSIRQCVEDAVYSSLRRVCGGGVSAYAAARNSIDDDWHQTLRTFAAKSVSFPNGAPPSNKNDSGGNGGGKPHDIEVRVALSLFHKYSAGNNSKKKKKSKRNRSDRKRSLPNDTCACNSAAIEVISEFGLRRPIRSAAELAKVISLDMEDSASLRTICDDCRPSSSGIICLVTKPRMEELRSMGKLPCPHCIAWCKGEKGLWWHTQKEHRQSHGDAKENATNAVDTLAIVVYDPSMVQSRLRRDVNGAVAGLSTIDTTNSLAKGESTDNTNDGESRIVDQKDPFAFAKSGDLQSLIKSLDATGLDPVVAMDPNGSTLLHWAAGGGALEVVKYLIESRSCDPNAGQSGKRSFRGRTALHWAARNGHVNVVKYLVEQCDANIEAVTMDGTSAFCWACWQGHLECMKYLYSRNCNVNNVNTFGCNAILWAAQGTLELDGIQWLESIGCNVMMVNANGHGILHKAAQRGKRNVIEWMFNKFRYKNCETLLTREQASNDFSLLIAPDEEDHCPSGLAGQEGHLDLAEFVCHCERELLLQICRCCSGSMPDWLNKRMDEGKHSSTGDACAMVWEAGGGIRRMLNCITSYEHDVIK